MKKDTLYIWVIVLLVLVNALQIGAFVFMPKASKAPHHRPPSNFERKGVEMLGLDSEQAEQFSELAHKHGAIIDSLNEQEKLLTVRYFNAPEEVDLAEIEGILSEKIKVTNDHFNDVRSILRPEQLDRFETFKKEAINRIIR